tara:strand:+ start:9340 stop:9447 length:108 start_codon:yes stop_codon:yes gene_type:complete
MGLANGNPLDFEKASRMTFIEGCVYYGYMKQFKNK